MSTARAIITRSLRLIRAIGTGETPRAEEINDGLTALNAMLDSMWNERLMIYHVDQESHSLTAGVGSYTIGPSGAIAVARPIEILDAYVRYNSVDYPLQNMTSEEYDRIPIKTISAIPEHIYYEPAYPQATIYLFPAPVGSMTLFLSVPKRLESFADLSEDVDLPPGYEDMLAYQLAVHLAPEYGLEPSPAVVALARDKKAILKRKNNKQPTVQLDAHLSGAGFNYIIPPT